MKARARISILFSLITFVVLLVSMLAFVVFGVILIKLDIVKVDRGLPEIFMLALFMLASILVGMFAHLILCKVPLNPIENLIEGMEQLTNGKFETRVDLGDGVILNRLAETFNKLAEELSNTEMLRSDFINNFSHEFKTPIVSILGFAKILNKCELEPEKQKEYLKAIEEEAERLSVMANSILTLTKIENQGILTDKKLYNISEQIRNCVLLHEKGWIEKELELDINFKEYNYTGNEQLLFHVWNNLIDNAIKFSYNKETLKIEISKSETDLIVKIINKGVVIPEEEKDLIFNKFYQVDKSHSSQGNGIGLSICKKIVELHHGKIFCETDGQNTIFVVHLPLELNNNAIYIKI